MNYIPLIVRYCLVVLLILLSNLTINAGAISDGDFSFSDDMLQSSLLNDQDYDDASTNSRVSPALLEAINNRPLFVESRRSAQQEDGSETSTLLIDGSYKKVELVGTIESTSKQIASFALGGEGTIWLQRNQYLGDWRIGEISPYRVQLISEEKIRFLRLRKNVSAENRRTED